MAVTDGYLRQGADVLQALGRADGLLFLAGPDTGTPGTISASGTLDVTAILAGAGGLADDGVVLAVAVLSGAGYLWPTFTLLAFVSEGGASGLLGMAAPGVVLIATRQPSTTGTADPRADAAPGARPDASTTETDAFTATIGEA